MVEQTRKKLLQDCLDCLDCSFTNSRRPQRKRFHHGKNCYAFDYYHCYLSTVLDQDTARYRMCSEQEKRVSLTEPYTTHS